MRNEETVCNSCRTYLGDHTGLARKRYNARMNIKDIKKIRSHEKYGAALIELVNDFHDREGTPEDERPDKAELEKALGKSRTGAEAEPPK